MVNSLHQLNMDIKISISNKISSERLRLPYSIHNEVTQQMTDPIAQLFDMLYFSCTLTVDFWIKLGQAAYLFKFVESM